jgi:hypothetical protein
MGEEIPCISVLTVILTHRSPLPLGQVGAPLLPGNVLLPSLRKPIFFFAFTHNNSSLLVMFNMAQVAAVSLPLAKYMPGKIIGQNDE